MREKKGGDDPINEMSSEFLLWEIRVHSHGELRSQYRIFLRAALVARVKNPQPYRPRR